MSYYAISNSNIFTCTVDNPCKGCIKFLPKANVQVEGKICIGWCKRFDPDPKQGYVYKRAVPPCVAWGFEGRKEEKKRDEGGISRGVVR